MEIVNVNQIQKISLLKVFWFINKPYFVTYTGTGRNLSVFTFSFTTIYGVKIKEHEIKMST